MVFESITDFLIKLILSFLFYGGFFLIIFPYFSTTAFPTFFTFFIGIDNFFPLETLLVDIVFAISINEILFFYDGNNFLFIRYFLMIFIIIKMTANI